MSRFGIFCEESHPAVATANAIGPYSVRFARTGLKARWMVESDPLLNFAEVLGADVPKGLPGGPV